MRYENKYDLLICSMQNIAIIFSYENDDRFQLATMTKLKQVSNALTK